MAGPRAGKRRDGKQVGYAARMWRVIYRILLVVALPWVWLRLKLKARRDPAYGERIGERFGNVPPGLPSGVVWFHTVSAGETIAAASTIASLADRHPDIPFLVTTMTPTGSGQVLARLADKVAHCYAPYDYRFAVRRFMDTVRPRLLVVMETELWPGWIDACHERGIDVCVVNARLSERSARGYARVGGLTRRMLSRVHLIAAQYPDHSERFVALGAPPERVQTLGSIKFDIEPPADLDERVACWRRWWRLDDSVWIAGSTHPGEDAVVLDAHAEIVEQRPGVRLILVPRHPERARDVETMARNKGFRVALLSAVDDLDMPEGAASAWDVLVCDRMGQLLHLYALSSVAFLGGSLVPVGGHNPIEPAIYRQPLVMGRERFNFADVAERFVDAGCLHPADDSRSLAAVVGGLLDNPHERARQGEAAYSVVEANRGAGQRLRALLNDAITAAGNG